GALRTTCQANELRPFLAQVVVFEKGQEPLAQSFRVRLQVIIRIPTSQRVTIAAAVAVGCAGKLRGRMTIGPGQVKVVAPPGIGYAYKYRQTQVPLNIDRALDRAIQEKVYQERQTKSGPQTSHERHHHEFHELLPVLFRRSRALNHAD